MDTYLITYRLKQKARCEVVDGNLVHRSRLLSALVTYEDLKNRKRLETYKLNIG